MSKKKSVSRRGVNRTVRVVDLLLRKNVRDLLTDHDEGFALRSHQSDWLVFFGVPGMHTKAILGK